MSTKTLPFILIFWDGTSADPRLPLFLGDCAVSSGWETRDYCVDYAKGGKIDCLCSMC